MVVEAAGSVDGGGDHGELVKEGRREELDSTRPNDRQCISLGKWEKDIN
jgi:hypothetical protein